MHETQPPSPTLIYSRERHLAPNDPSEARHKRIVGLIRLGLILVTVCLYGLDWTLSRGAYGDAFHHLMNGVFVHDVIRDPFAFMSDPMTFAANYYMHFPAVSLGYYMPGFAAIQALLMLVFGVSAATGQLAVLLCAVLMMVFSYEWFRLRMGHWWAAGGAVVLVSTPQFVYWGRDIMLEIPMVAFVIGAMWLFEKLCRQEHPRWTTAIGWGLLSAMAVLIKQHALMLLGIYFFGMFAVRRTGHLRYPCIWSGIAIIVAASSAVIAITFALGGDAVGHSVGFTPQHVVDRFNLEQWTYYLQLIPSRVGYMTLVLAGVGLISALQRRDRYVWTMIVWIVCFYLMHSFFKAQSARYAVLWIPPFCMLALIGLRFVSHGFEQPAQPGIRKIRWMGAMMLLIYTSTTLAHTLNINKHVVPSAYQRAADDLSERLGPFTCLTFFPDRPGRMAVCYRLAVEERARHEGADIYSFGSIIRAKQVLSGWTKRWHTVDALTQAVKHWNVKCILTESPKSIDQLAGDSVVQQAMQHILDTNEFKPIRTYLVNLDPRYRHPRRTMTLYERIEPIEFNPNALPPVHTGRIPVDVAKAAAE